MWKKIELRDAKVTITFFKDFLTVYVLTLQVSPSLFTNVGTYTENIFKETHTHKNRHSYLTRADDLNFNANAVQ